MPSCSSLSIQLVYSFQENLMSATFFIPLYLRSFYIRLFVTCIMLFVHLLSIYLYPQIRSLGIFGDYIRTERNHSGRQILLNGIIHVYYKLFCNIFVCYLIQLTLHINSKYLGLSQRYFQTRSIVQLKEEYILEEIDSFFVEI